VVENFVEIDLHGYTYTTIGKKALVEKNISEDHLWHKRYGYLKSQI